MTKAEALKLKPGDKVYCTVFAVRGWYTVEAIRPRDGYIKVTAYRTWNPHYNFEVTEK